MRCEDRCNPDSQIDRIHRLQFQDDRSYNFSMARPRRSAQTREKILDQGMHQFLLHGFHGTGLKELLQAIGVPKGSFYNFFESKEAFAAEVVERYSSQVLTALESIEDAARNDALVALRDFFTAVVEDYVLKDFSEGCLVGDLTNEIAVSSDLCRLALAGALRDWKGRFGALIELGQDQGKVRRDLTADDLADHLLSTWEGAVMRMKAERSARPVERALHLLFDHFFPAAPQPLPH